MKRIYLFNTAYEPDCASTNRVLAFARGFAESGVHTTLFFWKPSACRAKVSCGIEHLYFRYLWEECRFKSRYLNQFCSLIRFFFLMRKSIPVLTYDFQWLFLFSLRPGIRFFHERTEHPKVVGYRKSIKGRISYALYERALRSLAGLFVISPSLKEYFETQFGIPSRKVHIVNMIVDSTRFDKLEDSNPAHQIGYCGTMSEYKDGINYLVEAFAMVHKDFPQYRLALAGKWESEEVKHRTLKRIEELGIAGYVDFKGVVPSAKMPAFLKSCSVLALARPNQPGTAAGFASKIGEYLMTERPVVMTDLPDVEYFLSNGNDVYLAEANDANAFAAKVEEALSDYGKATEIGEQGRKTACRMFNYKIEAAKAAAIIFDA